MKGTTGPGAIVRRRHAGIATGITGALVAPAALLAMILLLGCAPSATATPPRTSEPTLPTVTVTRAAPPTGRETPTESPASLPVSTPSPLVLPTARAHLYDDVEEAEILSAVFPGLDVKQDEDVFDIAGSTAWKAWVNDRDEGQVTGAGESQLITIIANQIGSNPPKEASAFGPSNSWIVLLGKQDGKLVSQYRMPLDPAVSPDSGDVRLERTVDVDHDGRDEILVTAETVKEQVLRKDAFLFRWNGDALVRIWQGLEQYDNTAGLNQSEYYSYQGIIDISDLNGDGRDEISVEGERINYPKDSEGRSDIDHPSSTISGRLVYSWKGQAFALDSALSTPNAQPPVATP